LDSLVEPQTRGDPMTRLRWTTKSTRNLADELRRHRHQISQHSVARLLTGPLEYSLQGNAKTVEGKQHPDRDAQFRYINDRVSAALAEGEPVIRFDAKKELIGDYANKGRAWRPVGDPHRVEVHDFPGQQGKAVPYGVYDPGRRRGLGIGGPRRRHRAVRRGEHPSLVDHRGQRRVPGGHKAADHRGRGWLQRLSTALVEEGAGRPRRRDRPGDHGLPQPRGTSKWNRIEHRLFSHISLNWAGQPLTSHEVAVNLIAEPPPAPA